MKTIAFIGAGKIARALQAGLIQNGYSADNIWMSSPNIDKNTQLTAFPVHLTNDNNEAARHAEVIVFAVKPFVMKSVCESLKKTLQKKNNLLITVVTGTTTHSIAQWTGQTNIVRTMPNVAASVGAGVTGLFANNDVSDDKKSFAETLFRSVGATTWVKEEGQLDAITAISGSGPAYFFYLCEAMQAAGVALGLDKNQSKLLVAETALGAAKMMIESGDDFHVLREKVTSDKGTTMAATTVFDQHDLKNITKMAVKAAFSRAKELAS